MLAGNPRCVFDTGAGRDLLLCFLCTARDTAAQRRVSAVLTRKDLFDDTHAASFAVTADPGDESAARVGNSVHGFRVFWDFDGSVSRLYGALPVQEQAEQGAAKFRRFWMLLDPTLRVIAVEPFREDSTDIARIFEDLERLPPPDRFAGFEVPAPILILPRVFESDFCKALIAEYERQGGEESGFMREVDGRTVGIRDHSHKRRRDASITDTTIVLATQQRVTRRIVPEIARIHQFRVTRMERYIVGCYTREDGGHFSAHRDNTTKGTAHRRFAVSVNLNDAFEGGEACCPEYSPRGFKAPTGGDVIFSCSMLHRVTRVTAGRRYAFLPFLYDDAAARLRQENLAFLGETSVNTPPLPPETPAV